MASYNWQVKRYSTATSAWVTVTDVQNLSFGYGQRQLTDTWSPPVWTISGRRPDLLGTVNIGDWFSVYNSGSAEFIYQVTNYEVQYGIVPSMDTWSMTIETAFSALARSICSTSWFIANPGAAAYLLCESVGLRNDYVLTATGQISNQTITNENGLDVLSRILRTATKFLDPFGLPSDIYSPYSKAEAVNAGTATTAQSITTYDAYYYPAPTTYTYDITDSVSSSTQIVYDGLAFGSLNLNYATKVNVTPVGGATQTVGSGNTAFETTTYSFTNDLAAKVAQRYAGLLATAKQVPLSVTFTKEQQQSTAVIPNQIATFNDDKFCRITFRGNIFYATIIGQELTSTPDSTRITVYLCASENGNFFTLDSASLGVLDQNRLGI
jgi:hypothetical protein